MKSFQFLVLLSSLLFFNFPPSSYAQKEHDYLIKNALVIDGEGLKGYRADVLIDDDKIVEVGAIKEKKARTEINAKTFILTPGFIDAHTHSDFNPLVYPDVPNKIKQGVTTEVVGNCGMSAAPVYGTHGQRIQGIWAREGVETGPIPWKTFEEYSKQLEKKGQMTNWIALVGHGNLRSAVMGFSPHEASASEIEEMKKILRQAMKEGARGISFGLIYLPGIFSKEEEIIELCREAGHGGGICSFHMRSEGAGLLESIQEVIHVAEKTKAPVQISHLKVAGKANWNKIEEAVQMIEEARLKKGLRIGADVYPYTGSFAELGVLLPDALYQREDRVEYFRNPLHRESLLKELRAYFETRRTKWDSIMIAATAHEKFWKYEGKTIRQITRENKMEPEQFLIRLLADTSFEVSAYFFAQSDEVVSKVMAQPFVSIGSDSIADGSRKPHPRAYGTFPKIFREYVREKKILALGEAVRKMTALPAEQYGLEKRGKIKAGYFADLVLFDAGDITDRATYEEPKKESSGIHWVFVNGQPQIKKGKYTGIKSGRIL